MPDRPIERARPPLWSALRFTALPLERDGPRPTGVGGGVLPGAPPGAPPGASARAVVDRAGARRLVIHVDAAARALGVHPGIAPRQALAIAPGLELIDFDAKAQARHLDQLALWALGYSSRVVLQSPETILLEVQGSVRLFGGLAPLLERLLAGVRELGVTVSLGTAPTPLAAALLARAGETRAVRERGAIGAAIAPLSIVHLELPRETRAGLERSGLRTIGDLMRIPPPALARRFGHHLTETLYRLDGRLPDPRPAIVPPAVFHETIDLPLEARDTAALGFALCRLLAALGGFLHWRDLGVAALELGLHHHRHPPTLIALRFIEPASGVDHLRRIATERLARTPLPAPVIRLVLRAREFGEVDRAAPTLFGGDRAGESTSIAPLIETLVARLGEKAVYFVEVGDDHRPEHGVRRAGGECVATTEVRAAKAAKATAGTAGTAGAAWPARPLWLLRTPRAADAVEFIVCGEAERIESGWWDAVDVRRDYFIAEGRGGVRYWVFRARRGSCREPARLWIHGLFG